VPNRCLLIVRNFLTIALIFFELLKFGPRAKKSEFTSFSILLPTRIKRESKNLFSFRRDSSLLRKIFFNERNHWRRTNPWQIYERTDEHTTANERSACCALPK